jgi:hypothetical protein
VPFDIVTSQSTYRTCPRLSLASFSPKLKHRSLETNEQTAAAFSSPLSDDVIRLRPSSIGTTLVTGNVIVERVIAPTQFQPARLRHLQKSS